jgi:glycosyltransferase involved in cell wall biosynthesis
MEVIKMKVALLGEFPSQPIMNTANSIERHSSNDVDILHRFSNLSQIGADVIYYMNILDLLLHKEAYSQIENKKKKYKICGTVRSYRIVQDKNIQSKIRELEKYIDVLSFNNEEILNAIDFNGIKMRIREAPDETTFKQITEVSTSDKLRLGYVGTFREDKRFKDILEPLMKKYEQIVEFIVVGKAGKIIPYSEMNKFYNSIDVLLMPSRYEGAPLPPMEAALCGRMTVTTECPDMKDIFDNLSTTFVGLSDNIPSTITAFEDAILDLYSHRQDAAMKGQNAKKIIEKKRNWKDVIQDYNRMFEYCYE